MFEPIDSPSPNLKMYFSQYVSDNSAKLTEHVLSVNELLKSKCNVTHNYTTHDKSNQSAHRRNSYIPLLGDTAWTKVNQQLIDVIQKHYKNTHHRVVYMKSWVQSHNYKHVLGWHLHGSNPDLIDAHGILCVTTQPTVTRYKDCQVQNQAGKLYIGANILHSVENITPYPGMRITVAFNLITDTNALNGIISDYIPIMIPHT